MKDGLYQFSVSAWNYSNSGTLLLREGSGQGHDDHFAFSVTLNGTGHALVAQVKVERKTASVARTDLPHRFSLGMLGSGGDDTFNLIGTGPRGVIIEINADWSGKAVDRPKRRHWAALFRAKD